MDYLIAECPFCGFEAREGANELLIVRIGSLSNIPSFAS